MLSNTVNVQIHDLYNLGYKFDYDFNDLKSVDLMAAYRPNENNLFSLNYELFKKQLSFKGTEQLNKNTNIYFGIDYDLKNELKGFIEKPFKVQAGCENILSDDSKVKLQIKFDNDIIMDQVYTHRLNKNLKVGVAHQGNLTKFINEPSTASNYNIGLMINLSF